MEEFIEVKATRKSISSRRAVQGVGINDAPYMVKQPNSKVKVCPYYRAWHNMITRCYSAAYQKQQPTYQGCSVVKDWLIFSNFRRWMEGEYWCGKQLDKDLLIEGNKVYSPVSCIFVSMELNVLLADNSKRRGNYPQGVSFDTERARFLSRCKVKGKGKNLGRFDCVNRAELSYVTFKANHVEEAAYSEEALADSRLTPALLRHATKFTDSAEELTKLINKTT